MRLRDARPRQIIKDERAPTILRRLGRPTFITIDMWYWERGLCDRRYCIACFPLSNPEQHLIPDLLRRLLRLPQFRTRAARMGKVIRVRVEEIEYWQLGDPELHQLQWPEA